MTVTVQYLHRRKQRIRATYELFENKCDGVIKVAENIKEEKEENNYGKESLYISINNKTVCTFCKYI